VSTYAQVENVEDAWTRSFAPAELDRIQSMIDRAERLLLRRFPTLPARLADVADRLDVDTVTDVVVAMVTRVLRNAGGVRSQTSGPFSQVLDQAVASGRMEITREDRDQLGYGGGAAGTVAVVDPAIGRITRRVRIAGGVVFEDQLP
jgi:hypothetical protein